MTRSSVSKAFARGDCKLAAAEDMLELLGKLDDVLTAIRGPQPPDAGR